MRKIKIRKEFFLLLLSIIIISLIFKSQKGFYIGEKKPNCIENLCYYGNINVKLEKKKNEIKYIVRGNGKIIINVGKPKYLILTINGRKYYRKINEEEEIKLVKSFGLSNEEFLHFNFKTSYPTLRDGKIEVNISGEGEIEIRKGL